MFSMEQPCSAAVLHYSGAGGVCCPLLGVLCLASGEPLPLSCDRCLLSAPAEHVAYLAHHIYSLLESQKKRWPGKAS